MLSIVDADDLNEFAKNTTQKPFFGTWFWTQKERDFIEILKLWTEVESTGLPTTQLFGSHINLKMKIILNARVFYRVNEKSMCEKFNFRSKK